MNRLLLLTAAVLAVGGASAQEKLDRSDKSDRRSGRSEKERTPVAPTAQGFEAFRHVRTRNIFDPTRRGPRVETPPSAAASAAPRRSRSLSLTGTMVTQGRSLAFFGGAENRVIGVGESVANFKVTKIAATQVSLERAGKELQLDVGRQVALEGPGEIVEGAPVVEAAPEAPAAATGVPAAAAPAGGDKNEILRRMMERRAKEEGR